MDLERELAGHMHRLCAEIGARPMGSPEDHAAAEYVRALLDSAGLEIEEQRLPCPAWLAEEVSLDLDGSRLVVVANAYSPSVDVTAKTVAVSTEAELEAADMVGRIAILYGDLVKDPLTTKGCVLYEAERDWRIVRLLEEKRPDAIITVNQRIGSVEGLIEDWQFGIPSATVPAEVGLRLLANPGQPVSLRISTRSAPGHSATIIGRRAGSGKEILVICAHYDTKIGTPGAWDNASGVAALLALGRILGGSPSRVGLEFVAFTGEEYGMGLHDLEYVRRSGDRFGSILAAINMDGIGHRLRTDTVAIMSHSEPFQMEVDRVLRHHAGIVWTDPWPQSNHSTFAWRGVPSIAISSLGHGTAGFAHSPADSIEWISPARLGEVVHLVADVVRSLDDKPASWTRPSQADGQ